MNQKYFVFNIRKIEQNKDRWPMLYFNICMEKKWLGNMLLRKLGYREKTNLMEVAIEVEKEPRPKEFKAIGSFFVDDNALLPVKVVREAHATNWVGMMK